MKFETTSGDELKARAAEFARSLSRGDRATVVTLSGDLGAGKTTFTQGMAAALGVEEPVTSPTFVIEKIYALKDQAFSHLIHIDAYRLTGSHELEVLGWKAIVAEPGNLVVIEWPERVPELIPEDVVELRFDIEGEGRRISHNGDEKEN